MNNFNQFLLEANMGTMIPVYSVKKIDTYYDEGHNIDFECIAATAERAEEIKLNLERDMEYKFHKVIITKTYISLR